MVFSTLTIENLKDFIRRVDIHWLSLHSNVIYSHNKYAYIHIYMFMQDTYWRNKFIRRSNKRHRKISLTKYIPLTLLQGFEKVGWGFTVRGSWRSNITAIFWPQTYGCHVVSFLFFWCSTEALGSTLLGAGFLYCILSASSLDPNSSGPQAPSAWRGFPYHISSPLELELNWLVELNWVM